MTSDILFVLLSSTTLGSKKKVKTNFCFSPGLSVCFSKQKQPILFKYTPNGDGETLKEAEPDDLDSETFSTKKLTLCTSPGLKLKVFFSG